MLDLAHVGRRRVAVEELPHRLAGVVTGCGRGAARDDRASGPPAHAGSWALPSLLLHIKRCLLDWCDSGPGKSGATHYCKEKGAPRHPAARPSPLLRWSRRRGRLPKLDELRQHESIEGSGAESVVLRFQGEPHANVHPASRSYWRLHSSGTKLQAITPPLATKSR